MYTWPVIVGVIVVAIVALIPVVMVGQLLYNVVASSMELRRAETRKVTAIVSGLGLLSSTNGMLWVERVRDLQVTLDSPGGPPTQRQTRQLLSVLDQLPSLIMRARDYLAEREDMSWLEGGAAAFEPIGIDFETDSKFVLESVHPSDPDGIYRVEFQDGVAVGSGRDD